MPCRGKAFTRRSPVLAVYQPIWCGRRAECILQTVLPPDCCYDGCGRVADLARGCGWPSSIVNREASVVTLAVHLYPDLPWAQWALDGHYPPHSMFNLREGAALLHGQETKKKTWRRFLSTDSESMRPGRTQRA